MSLASNIYSKFKLGRTINKERTPLYDFKTKMIKEFNTNLLNKSDSGSIFDIFFVSNQHKSMLQLKNQSAAQKLEETNPTKAFIVFEK